jgi:Glucuronate isomerase
MGFIDDNFLLHSKAALRLYHQYAAKEPILDYHSHLPAQEIAADRQFPNLCEIWLAGDHYKWRAMRANGIGERYCTGDASAYQKFLAWARTVPFTLRNPLYHWTHLELQRYFNIDVLLNESTAKSVWEQANILLPPAAISRTARLAARFSLAVPGGFWTRRKPSNGNSTRCPIAVYCLASSAWSRIPAPSCPSPATNIPAASCAILSAENWRRETCRMTNLCSAK